MTKKTNAKLDLKLAGRNNEILRWKVCGFDRSDREGHAPGLKTSIRLDSRGAKKDGKHGYLIRVHSQNRHLLPDPEIAKTFWSPFKATDAEEEGFDHFAEAKAWCQEQVARWIGIEKEAGARRDAEKVAEAQRRLDEQSARNVRDAAKVQAIRLARETLIDVDVGVRTRDLAKAVLTAFGEASTS